jgi:hypothetical protein
MGGKTISTIFYIRPPDLQTESDIGWMNYQSHGRRRVQAYASKLD